MATAATLTSLPIELILQISEYLYSIDEVQSLFFTSRRFHAILSQHDNLYAVLGSLIKASPIHSHDAQLCHFADTSRTLKLQQTQEKDHENQRGQLHRDLNSGDASNRQTAALLRNSFYSAGAGLSSEHVWAIVERWNALKAYYSKTRRFEECVSVMRGKSMMGEEEEAKARKRQECGFPVCKRKGVNRSIVAWGTAEGFEEYYKGCMKVWLTVEIESLMSIL